MPVELIYKKSKHKCVIISYQCGCNYLSVKWAQCRFRICNYSTSLLWNIPKPVIQNRNCFHGGFHIFRTKCAFWYCYDFQKFPFLLRTIMSMTNLIMIYDICQVWICLPQNAVHLYLVLFYLFIYSIWWSIDQFTKTRLIDMERNVFVLLPKIFT